MLFYSALSTLQLSRKIKRQKYEDHLAPLLALKKIRADLLPFAF
jgi:hypothetical protein